MRKSSLSPPSWLACLSQSSRATSHPSQSPPPLLCVSAMTVHQLLFSAAPLSTSSSTQARRSFRTPASLSLEIACSSNCHIPSALSPSLTTTDSSESVLKPHRRKFPKIVRKSKKVCSLPSKHPQRIFSTAIQFHTLDSNTCKMTNTTEQHLTRWLYEESTGGAHKTNE